jgi:Ala-tRNA(Pro) deacylase
MNEETALRTYHFLKVNNIPYEYLNHQAAYTMEECASIEAQLGAPICKNLFLCNRQQTQFYLLMLPAGKVFKTKYLSSQLGCARLSFADESHMVNLLNIHPGAVSPMGLINDTEHKVLLVVDKDLLNQEYIGCHPCVNTASIRIALNDLLQKFVPVTGHTYRLVELSGE